MREVAIIGVGAHPTGQFSEKPLKELAYTAIWGAIDDAGVTPADINVAYVGNSLGGLLDRPGRRAWAGRPAAFRHHAASR